VSHERDEAVSAVTGRDELSHHHVLTEADRSIAKDLRKAETALEVVQHFVENRSEYDVVNLSTALHRVAVLTEGVKAWKREPLPRAAVNALVNDSIDRLREYAASYHQVTLDAAAGVTDALGEKSAAALGRQRSADAALTAVSTRAIASSEARGAGYTCADLWRS
jgi:hypothetical protein